MTQETNDVVIDQLVSLKPFLEAHHCSTGAIDEAVAILSRKASVTNDVVGLIKRLRATWKYDSWIATNRTAPPIRGEVEKPVNPDGPEAADALQSQSARIAELRDPLIVARQCISSFRSGAEYATQQYIDTVLCKIDTALASLTKDSTSATG